MPAGQRHLEGQEPEVHKDVIKAALAYEVARNERMEKTGPEKEAKNTLIAVMQDHKLTSYTFDDGETIEVVLETKANIKVKRTEDPEED
jgi:hypothetical protein